MPQRESKNIPHPDVMHEYHKLDLNFQFSLFILLSLFLSETFNPNFESRRTKVLFVLN